MPDRKSRVLFLFPEFPLENPVTGGEIYNAEVIRAALDQGDWDVAMVPRPQRLPGLVRRSALCRRAWYQLACLGAVLWAPCDLVVTDGSYHSWVLLAVAWLRFVRRVPMVGMAYHVRHVSSRRSGIRLRMERWGERSLYRMMRHMITCSYAARSDFADDGLDADKIEVIYPATSLSLPDAQAVANWRQERAAGAVVRMLCVGKVVARKGYHHQLEACSRLNVPWTLEIIGDYDESGEYAQQLNKIVRERSLGNRVTFRGFVSAEELAVAYTRATLSCMPSLQEGYGIALVEAMGYGLPIVATTAGSIPELVEDDVSGLLVPAGDPAALATAITQLAQDAALYARISEGARKRSLELDRDWDAVANEAIALLGGWL